MNAKSSCFNCETIKISIIRVITNLKCLAIFISFLQNQKEIIAIDHPELIRLTK